MDSLRCKSRVLFAQSAVSLDSDYGLQLLVFFRRKLLSLIIELEFSISFYPYLFAVGFRNGLGSDILFQSDPSSVLSNAMLVAAPIVCYCGDSQLSS